MSFMASLLTHSFRNRRKFTVILREAKQMGLRILPPDINLSVYEFSQVHKAIRTGLLVVSGMGPKAYAELADVRKGGDFNDLMDLVRRTDPRLINTRLLANLVKAGALDCFGLKRSQMLHMIEQDVELARRNAATPNLFDQPVERQPAIPGIDPPNIPEMALPEIIRNEIAAAGYCISYDQLHLYRDLVKQCRALSPDMLTTKMVGREVHVAGFLDHVETESPLVEDQDQLLLDLEGHVVTMPTKVSDLYDQALHASAPLLIGGTVHRRKDEVYVKAITAFTLRMVQQMSQHVLQLDLDLTGEDSRTLWLIRNLVVYYRGKGTRVRIHNLQASTFSRWWMSKIERTPVFFSPPFYYALKKILPEDRITLVASEDMDPALLHALSPLRFEKTEPRYSATDDREENSSIVDMY
jgi:DNA polymerase III alpha subunit